MPGAAIIVHWLNNEAWTVTLAAQFYDLKGSPNEPYSVTSTMTDALDLHGSSHDRLDLESTATVIHVLAGADTDALDLAGTTTDEYDLHSNQ